MVLAVHHLQRGWSRLPAHRAATARQARSCRVISAVARAVVVVGQEGLVQMVVMVVQSFHLEMVQVVQGAEQVPMVLLVAVGV